MIICRSNLCSRYIVIIHSDYGALLTIWNSFIQSYSIIEYIPGIVIYVKS